MKMEQREQQWDHLTKQSKARYSKIYQAINISFHPLVHQCMNGKTLVSYHAVGAAPSKHQSHKYGALKDSRHMDICAFSPLGKER